MLTSENRLFNKYHLSDILRSQLTEAEKKVSAISKEQFLANSDDEVVAHIFSILEITPIALRHDLIVRTEPRETHFEINGQSTLDGRHGLVPGVELVATIPYIGETDLWLVQPSSFSSVSPRGDVSPIRESDQLGELMLRFGYYHGQFSGDTVNREFTEALTTVEEYLGWIRNDIETHNARLQQRIAEVARTRRQRLDAIHEQAKTILIPLERREGTPNPTILPIHRKVIQPLSTKPSHTPDYAIADADYQDILQVIRHEGATFERTPSTYSLHGEEGLRDFILGHLNGYFQGRANSETFRKNGKTDISIESENRAAFVAECKVWRGEKQVREAVDQLLGYLTWRDAKTALVLFNKEVAGFTGIQGKLPESLRSHPNFISIEELRNGGEWRLRLRSKDDPEAAITTQIFLFNLYVQDKSKPEKGA